VRRLGSRFLTIFYSFVAGMDLMAVIDSIQKDNPILSALNAALTIVLLWIAHIESKKIH